MTRRPLVLFAVLATLAGGLAACSSGDKASPGASPSANANAQRWLELGRQFSQCAREHGYPNFPDPVMNAEGDEPVYPASANIKDQARAVAEIPECKAIDDQIVALHAANAPTLSAADLQKLKEFAQCLRDQGLAGWPDPDADGKFPIIGTPLEAEGKSARLLAAIDACKQYWDQGFGVS